MCRAVSRGTERFVNSVGHCHADPEHPRLRCPGATFRHELRGDRRRCRDAASGLLDVCVYHGCPCSSEQCAWNLQIWVLCCNIGLCTSYPILLGDFGYALSQQLGFAEWTSRKGCMAVMVGCICWPLSCAPSLGFLRPPGALGVWICPDFFLRV
ncbi:slc38a6 [Symbiodinium sp. KB8]|nr:slc38a6 [Symbiodinium sp. KB8]